MTDVRELFAIGSRVKCGISHTGILMNYFTGPNKQGEATLYAAIRLDKQYTVQEPNFCWIDVLVVFAGNLRQEEKYG